MVQNDFNMLELDAIILSYEKNLTEKEKLLKNKQEKIKES